MIYNNM